MVLMSLKARHDAAAQAFGDALAHFGALIRKYAANQPRVPAGNPDGGQWTSGETAAADVIVNPFSAFLDSLPQILLAGGFEKEDMGKTVQEFVAEKCRRSIREVLPGQFLEMPIAEVLALADNGDAAARRCKKLLSRGRFKK